MRFTLAASCSGPHQSHGFSPKCRSEKTSSLNEPSRANVTFGLLVVPYRLIRRGQRKRKIEALRQRELLAAIGHEEPVAGSGPR